MMLAYSLDNHADNYNSIRVPVDTVRSERELRCQSMVQRGYALNPTENFYLTPWGAAYRSAIHDKPDWPRRIPSDSSAHNSGCGRTGKLFKQLSNYRPGGLVRC